MYIFVSGLLTNAYDYNALFVGNKELTFLQAITANSFFLDLNVRVVVTCHAEGQTERFDLIHDGWRQDLISFVLASVP